MSSTGICKSVTLFVLVFVASSFSLLYADGKSSIFHPEVYSSYSPSFLIEPQPYDPLPEMDDGLSTPFESLDVFYSAVYDAFRLKPQRQRIFTYGYKTNGLDFRSEINALAGYEYTHDPDFAYGFLYKGMRLNASVNENWSMRSIWYSGAFFGDSEEAVYSSPLVDSYYKTNSDKIWVDNLSGDISYKNDNFYLSLGRDKFQIGNSISGSIILSKAANEYGFFLAEASLGAFQISLLHATLISDKPIAVYNDNSLANSRHYPDKYLALHQISYSWRDRLQLFFGESVIYGDRGMDVNYLLPQAFWRVTEHNLRDRDNILIYAGGSFKAHQKVMLYAQAIIDEMRYAEVFGNWWGNKYAFQSGIQLGEPNAMKPKLTLEFTAVRPWIYAHYLPYSPYSHDGKPLGHPKGANLLDYSLELDYPLPLYSSFNFHTSYTRQGSFGNHFSLNYHEEIDDIDNATADWLEGDISDTLAIQTMLKTAVFAHHKLMIGHKALFDRDTWTHQIYAGWQLIY